MYESSLFGRPQWLKPNDELLLKCRLLASKMSTSEEGEFLCYDRSFVLL